MSDQWPHRGLADGEWYQCNAFPAYGDGWMCPGEDGAVGCASCMAGQMASHIEALEARAVLRGGSPPNCTSDEEEWQSRGVAWDDVLHIQWARLEDAVYYVADGYATRASDDITGDLIRLLTDEHRTIAAESAANPDTPEADLSECPVAEAGGEE